MHLAAKGGVCVVGKTNKLRLHRRYIAAKGKVWSIRYVLLAATFLHRPSRTHNLEYRFGHSGKTVVIEIYFEQGPPIEKLIFATMVAGRSAVRGSSTRCRTGLSNNNSSTMYPAVVPSENITIRPFSPSFSTFSMFVLPFMTKSVPHRQAADYPVLLSLVARTDTPSRRTGSGVPEPQAE
jgi:hypothetical protein